MNFQKIIKKYKKSLFLSHYFELRRKQRFLSNVMSTNYFSKMKLCDKVTSLAKLVQVSKDDFGEPPKELDKKLVELSVTLRRMELDQIKMLRADK